MTQEIELPEDVQVFLRVRIQTDEELELLRHYIYLIRLLAFVIIIFGILDKNRRTDSL